MSLSWITDLEQKFNSCIQAGKTMRLFLKWKQGKSHDSMHIDSGVYFKISNRKSMFISVAAMKHWLCLDY